MSNPRPGPVRNRWHGGGNQPSPRSSGAHSLLGSGGPPDPRNPRAPTQNYPQNGPVPFPPNGSGRIASNFRPPTQNHPGNPNPPAQNHPPPGPLLPPRGGGRSGGASNFRAQAQNYPPPGALPFPQNGAVGNGSGGRNGGRTPVMGPQSGGGGGSPNFDGPAKRKGSARVRGFARRKGEWKPWHYGLDISNDLLGHPAFIDSKPLPPLGGYPKENK